MTIMNSCSQRTEGGDNVPDEEIRVPFTTRVKPETRRFFNILAAENDIRPSRVIDLLADNPDVTRDVVAKLRESRTDLAL